MGCSERPRTARPALLMAIALLQRVGGALEPTGIFTDISENDLLHIVGLECDYDAYVAPYSHATTSYDIDHSNAASHRYVLVGAKSNMTSGIFKVVAIGEYSVVFNATSSTRDVRSGGGGAYWYYQSGYAFGFTPLPSVKLARADHDPTDCEQKLSWHLDTGSGGWSAGCNRALWDDYWHKVVKYCNPHRLMHYSSDRLTVLRTKVSPGQAKSFDGPPIRIGAAVTLDCCSRHSDVGTSLARAYLLFVEWVNTVHGGLLVNGHRHALELTLVGDRSKPDVARRATEYLVEHEGIQLLLGPYGSLLTNQSAAVAQDAGAVMIAPSAAATYVYRDRPRIFGIATLPSEQFTTVVAELGRHGARTIALLQESAYPPDACGAVLSLASLSGMEVVYSFTFPSEDVYDVDSILRTLSQKNPDVMIACLFTQLCQTLFREVQSHELDVSALIFTTCATSPDWLSEFSDTGRHVTSVTPWLPSLGLQSQVSQWSSQEFAAAYFKAYQEEPGYEAAASWAAAETLVHALQWAGSFEPAQIAEVLRSIDIMTLYGRVAFNSDGQNMNDWKVVQYFPESEAAQLVAPVAAGMTAKEWAYPRPPWNTQACFQYPSGASKKCMVGLNASGHCGNCGKSHFAVWSNGAWQNLAGCKCQEGLCPLGQVLAAGSCEACPPGKHVHESGFCMSCGRGAYAAQSGSLSCEQCAAGRFAVSARQTACEICPAGRASFRGRTSCIVCTRGTNASEPGMSKCLQCPPGTYSEDEGTQYCKSCPPGKISVWGGYNCSECPVGKYQASAGMSMCFDCPLGTTCESRSTVLPSTIEGWWRLRYSTASDDQWLPCSSEELCTAEEKCRSGHTGVLCEVCMPGYFKNHRLIHCEECQAWFFHMSMAVIFGTLVSVIIYISTAMSVESTGKASAITDALLKLLFNYITTTSITAGVFQAIFIESVRQHLYETGKHHEYFPIILNRALLRLSFTEFYSWLVPAECIFQPTVRADDQEWIDLLSALNITSSLTWVEALADMHHTETLPNLKGVGGTFQVPAHLALAQKRLQDYHWRSAFRQQLFWFFVPVYVLAMITLIGFFLVMFFLWLRQSRNRKVIEFLDMIHEQGLRAAARGRSREDCYYFLEVADRRLLGLYPLIRYARLRQGPVLKMLKCYFIDSEPLMLVSLFFLYPTMVETLLQPLRCKFPFEKIGKNLVGHDFMITSPNLECYKPDDPLFWLSMSGMLIYTVGVPAVGAWKLYRNRYNLTRHFNQTWGFLMSGYEISMRHWECLVLFRKSLTLLLVSVSMLDGLRLLLLMLNSATFTLLHIWYAPFDNRFNELLDRVETRHLLVWVLFCMGILWTYLEGETRGGRDGLTVSVYVVSISVAILHMWFMYMILRQILRHGSASYAEHLVKQREKEDMVTNQMAGVASSGNLQGSSTKNLKTGSTKSLTRKSLTRKSLRSNVVTQSSSRRNARRRAAREDSTGDKSIFDLTTSEGFLLHVRQLSLRDIGRNWRNLLYWFESCVFGSWAGRHYMKYLDRKPYLVCDARETWFMLMGVHSYEAAQEPGRIAKISASKMPGMTKAPNEKQRRYLVKIIEEVFEYIIVDQRFSMFSPTLLEFMIRVGFCFDDDGSLRTHAQRQCADEDDERPSAQARSSSKTSLMSASSSSSDSSGFRLSTGGFADPGTAMLRTSTVPTPDGGTGSPQPDKRDSALGWGNILSFKGTATSKSSQPASSLASLKRAMSLQAQQDHHVTQVSSLNQAVTFAQRTSMEFDDSSSRNRQMFAQVKSPSWLSDNSRVSRISGLSDYMARGSVNTGLTDEQVQLLVHEMLRPEIFSTGVQLEELQLNLDVLRTVPRDRLQYWLSEFEVEWSNRLTERLLLASGMKDRDTQRISSVEISIPERPGYQTAVSFEEGVWHSTGSNSSDSHTLAPGFDEPTPPSLFGSFKHIRDSFNSEESGEFSEDLSDMLSSGESEDSNISSQGASQFFHSEGARTLSFFNERATQNRRVQARLDEWDSLQNLRGYSMSDDLLAEWSQMVCRLLFKGEQQLASMMGASAVKRLHSQEALAHKSLRQLAEKVAARRKEFAQDVKQAMESQAVQNKLIEKEERKLRNALAATEEAKKELSALRERLAAVPPLKKGGMRATLQAMREAKQQRQRLSDSDSNKTSPEKSQAAAARQAGEASREVGKAYEDEQDEDQAKPLAQFEEEAPDQPNLPAQGPGEDQVKPLMLHEGHNKPPAEIEERSPGNEIPDWVPARGQRQRATRGCSVLTCVERDRESRPR